LRQLLWHRHRMVQARTRVMNPLQAVALQRGLRCKKRLWREAGREQLEAFPLAPWASRRRRDLLELLDRLSPTIAEADANHRAEAEKCPAARRLRTHPGVGSRTALAFVLIIGKRNGSSVGKQIASYLGLVPSEDSSGDRRRWDTSASKATGCCVSCWWRRRKLTVYAAFRNGGVSISLGDATRTEDSRRVAMDLLS